MTEKNTLYVCGFDLETTTAKSLARHFERFGQIQRVDLPQYSIHQRARKNIAFINFNRPEDAEYARRTYEIGHYEPNLAGRVHAQYAKSQLINEGLGDGLNLAETNSSYQPVLHLQSSSSPLRTTFQQQPTMQYQLPMRAQYQPSIRESGSNRYAPRRDERPPRRESSSFHGEKRGSSSFHGERRGRRESREEIRLDKELDDYAKSRSPSPVSTTNRRQRRRSRSRSPVRRRGRSRSRSPVSRRNRRDYSPSPPPRHHSYHSYRSTRRSRSRSPRRSTKEERGRSDFGPTGVRRYSSPSPPPRRENSRERERRDEGRDSRDRRRDSRGRRGGSRDDRGGSRDDRGGSRDGRSRDDHRDSRDERRGGRRSDREDRRPPSTRSNSRSPTSQHPISPPPPPRHISTPAHDELVEPRPYSPLPPSSDVFPALARTPRDSLDSSTGTPRSRMGEGTPRSRKGEGTPRSRDSPRFGRGEGGITPQMEKGRYRSTFEEVKRGDEGRWEGEGCGDDSGVW